MDIIVSSNNRTFHKKYENFSVVNLADNSKINPSDIEVFNCSNQNIGECIINVYKLKGIKIVHAIGKPIKSMFIDIKYKHAKYFMGFSLNGGAILEISGKRIKYMPYEHIMQNCLGFNAIIRVGKSPFEFVKILINSDILKDFVDYFGCGIKKHKLANGIIFRDSKFNMNFTAEIFEVTKQLINCNLPDRIKIIYLDIKVRELFLLQHNQHKFLSSEKGKIYPIDKAVIQEAIEIIHNEYLNPPNIKNICNRVGISESKFRIQFQQHIKTTVNKYIIKLRMNHAVKLLAEEGFSISDVSYILNFSNPNHFSRAFKNFYGDSPKKLSISLQNANNPQIEIGND